MQLKARCILISPENFQLDQSTATSIFSSYTHTPLTVHTAPQSVYGTFGTLADAIAGTVYFDLTGKLPARSINRNQYFFVLYSYSTNAILLKPVANLNNATGTKAFEEQFKYLESKGFKPCFNVSDNQASTTIKRQLMKEKSKW